MKTKTFIITACLLAAVGVSCASNDAAVVDRPTPAGQVQAPISSEPVNVQYAPADPSIAAAAADEQAAIAGFATKYQGAKKPRIAVYVNRQLSADPREWISDVRDAAHVEGTRTTESSPKTTTTSGQGNLAVQGNAGPLLAGADLKVQGGASQTTTESGSATKETVQETASVAVERRVNEGERPAWPESWQFRMEDAFINQLLPAGVILVDRALMMRLTAADAGSTPGAQIQLKPLEINALRGKADILAELVVSQDPDPKHGYVYRVSAYDVNTGQVLLSTDSGNWPRSQRIKGELVATDEGYKRTITSNPAQAGKRLAVAFMNGLAARW